MSSPNSELWFGSNSLRCIYYFYWVELSLNKVFGMHFKALIVYICICVFLISYLSQSQKRQQKKRQNCELDFCHFSVAFSCFFASRWPQDSPKLTAWAQAEPTKAQVEPIQSQKKRQKSDTKPAPRWPHEPQPEPTKVTLREPQDDPLSPTRVNQSPPKAIHSCSMSCSWWWWWWWWWWWCIGKHGVLSEACPRAAR